MVAHHVTAAVLDADAHAWPGSLRAAGAAGDEARARLRALLLRAARLEVARRSPSLPDARRDDLEGIVFEIADHALASVLERLDDFTDDRHFGTWALKFALREATVRLQTRAWRGRELPDEPDPQTYCSSVGSEPEASPEQRELLSALPAAIADALTPEQRHVLGALALNGVPIDVLAERLESSRGAVYETLRDARQRLRTHLGRRGPTVP